MFRCPGDQSVSTHGGVAYPRVRTVAMNCWLSEGRLSQSPGFKVIKKCPSPNNPHLVWLQERTTSPE